MNDKQTTPPVIRQMPFEFPADLQPHWIPDEPEFAAMVNGASLVMPYLEPFLIRTMREALQQIESDALQADGAAFMAQEGQHFRAHRRFNDRLKEHYPELAAVEEAMTESYARLAKRSLAVRMAYTAGFESMTIGVTRWLVEDRVRLFSGADPRPTSLVLWHMVEESEHKCVAYDVFQAVHGGYWRRVFGLFHGSFDVVRFSMRGYRVMLREDGLWTQWRSRLRLASRLWRFVRNVAPALLHAALPWHDPRSVRDPGWVSEWIDGYRRTPVDGVPLVDTTHPDIPVPFPAPARGVAP